MFFFYSLLHAVPKPKCSALVLALLIILSITRNFIAVLIATCACACLPLIANNPFGIFPERHRVMYLKRKVLINHSTPLHFYNERNSLLTTS